MAWQDDYENYDQFGNLISTGGFKPQMNGSQYGGMEYQNFAAPRQSNALSQAAPIAGAVNPALGIGLKAAGGLFGMIAGSGARKIRKQGLTGLRGMIGKPVYDVNAGMGFARQGTYADAEKLGNQFDRNFGLDTGRGAGMFGKEIVGRLATQGLGLFTDEAKARADRDFRINQILSQWQG